MTDSYRYAVLYPYSLNASKMLHRSCEQQNRLPTDVVMVFRFGATFTYYIYYTTKFSFVNVSRETFLNFFEHK